MSITRLLILGGLLGLAACSSPTGPNARLAETESPESGHGVGVVQPCGQQSASYPICSGKK